MKIRVSPAVFLKGTVSAPPSKSYTHRAILLASLAEGKSTIKNPLLSEDTKATIAACRKMGAKIEEKEGALAIEGVLGKPCAGEKIDVANSGTTLRMMSSIFSLASGKTVLSGDESIARRPMQPLLDTLAQLGVKVSSKDGKTPVEVEGPLKPGRCAIRGDVSSQFISGLLIALPLASGDSMLEITGELKSRPYLEMTLELMKRFGVSVERKGNTFQVKGGQKYLAADYSVEGDYSSAAFMLAAGALIESEVTVTNLKRDSRQGDKKIVEILKEMGCRLNIKEDSVTVKGNCRLHGLELDLGDAPDLVPITSVLGALASGRTAIRNVGHVRLKESDRLKAMSSELSKMGADARDGPSHIETHGTDTLIGNDLSGYGDHRIVMALAIAALRANSESTIDSAESIAISYPRFVEDMQALGAEISFF